MKTPRNPLLLPSDEQFSVGTSDFAYFDNPDGRCENGALLLVRKGRAYLTADSYQGVLCRNMSLLLLPGSLMVLQERSEDFSADFFAFTPRLFSEAAFRLEIDFLRMIKQQPATSLSHDALRNLDLWLQIIRYTYNDRENRFRNTIIRNRLQNALLESCDKAMRHPEWQLQQKENTRQNELFTRFVQLVNQHCIIEREVTFYARELCISTRYLSSIVRTISGRKAKELIDQATINEIKLLLQTTELSIQEIAYRMHFPDQSYLGRYFRKHVGVSPSAFRLER